MSEDMIRVDELRNQSIAEMNLIEQLTSIIDTIEKASQRLGDMLNALQEEKYELAKKGYEYVRIVKENAQEKKEESMEYLVRVSPNLMYKEIFMLTLNHLDALSQIIDELGFKVSLVARLKTKCSSLASINEMFSRIKEMLSLLRHESKNLNINPKQSLEQHSKILSLENTVDQNYRSLDEKILENRDQLQAVEALLLKDVINLIEDAADKIRETSYGLKYIALHRF